MKWIMGIIFVGLIWYSISAYHKNKIASNELNYCANELYETSTKLNQANDSIEEAQSHAWESYEEMGFALDNLEVAY